MLVVTRYQVPQDETESFAVQARTALDAMSRCAGFVRGRVGRAVDDARLWTFTTEWMNVGAYRRALGSYEVKLHAVPLMYRAVDEPSAFEDLVTAVSGGRLTEHAPSRAEDADSASPGRSGSR